MSQKLKARDVDAEVVMREESMVGSNLPARMSRFKEGRTQVICATKGEPCSHMMHHFLIHFGFMYLLSTCVDITCYN